MLFKGIDFLDYNYSTVGYLALASFLCPILAFGLVPLFESFFGITTDLSLIELLDYDQPLLKKLMEKNNIEEILNKLKNIVIDYSPSSKIVDHTFKKIS